jgi:glutamate:GABA antiporter
MIRLQREPAPKEAIRVPGGRWAGTILGSVGLLTTAVSIVLALIPAPDEPNKVLAVTKVAGLTLLLVGAGALVYALGLRKR